MAPAVPPRRPPPWMPAIGLAPADEPAAMQQQPRPTQHRERSCAAIHRLDASLQVLSSPPWSSSSSWHSSQCNAWLRQKMVGGRLYKAQGARQPERNWSASKLLYLWLLYLCTPGTEAGTRDKEQRALWHGLHSTKIQPAACRRAARSERPESSSGGATP